MDLRKETIPEESTLVDIITRQTTLTREEARERLKESDNNHIQVIEEFMGIKKEKKPEIKSLQQEIYKQIRCKMDNSIKIYNQKQERKLEKDIDVYLKK
jgi:hypothetical protein